LLVPALAVGQLESVLLKRLTEAGHVAMAKDPEHRGHEPACLPIQLTELHLEVLDDRLPGGQPKCRPGAHLFVREPTAVDAGVASHRTCHQWRSASASETHLSRTAPSR